MKELSRATIYDVAAQARVSITTVSRYLNDPKRVRTSTADQIRRTIEALGYYPHGNAGRAHRLGRVGVLTPFFGAPSFIQRLQGLSAVLRAQNLEMVVFTVESAEERAEYLESLPLSKLDGLVVLSMGLTDPEVDRLASAGLETVVVEQNHPRLCSVVSDNIRGGHLAAELFLSKDYGPCGFLGEATAAPYGFDPSGERWVGYRDTLARAGQPVLPGLVRLGGSSVAEGERGGWELLSAGIRPRAIFAVSDLLAIGVLRAARKKGLRVPDDVAVLGFDDIEAASYFDLSTVSQGLAESGRVAAELLVARLREAGRPRQTVQLNVEVVQRATT